jgi:hypothetical protein
MTTPLSLDDFLSHPDHSTAASFVFGLVAYSSLRHLLIISGARNRLDQLLQKGVTLLRDSEDEATQRRVGDIEKGGIDSSRRETRDDEDIDLELRLREHLFERSRVQIAPDRGRLTALLDLMVFIYSMSGFATLLGFSPGAATGGPHLSLSRWSRD